MAVVYRLILHIGYGTDTLDSMAAANRKAAVKRLIELVNKHKNMTSVPKRISCRTSITVPCLDLVFSFTALKKKYAMHAIYQDVGILGDPYL